MPALIERRLDTEHNGNCVTTWWYIVGPKGAVQYMDMHIRPVDIHIPMDLGIHRRAGPGEGMLNCRILDGANCHFTASYSGAADVFERYLRSKDLEDIWRALEETYHAEFGEN